METVAFTRMEDGSEEEYRFLGRLEDEFVAGVADRVLDHLSGLEGSVGGYAVTRLGHSLQTATLGVRYFRCLCMWTMPTES